MYTPNPKYQSALDYLFSQTNYENFKTVPYQRYQENLDRLEAFLYFIGSPHLRLKMVHVAGTKGKGSVCTMLEAALRATGYRTGLFTSPHLFSLLERFSINGSNCSEELFAETFFDLLSQWNVFIASAAFKREISADSNSESLTFFEWSVVIAFELFRKANVDLVILETGLGGRFDATNVCRPLVSVITSISYDHTEQLGTTLLQIAGEKCGIIKEKTPVVSGIGGSLLFEETKSIAQPKSRPITKFDIDQLRGLIRERAIQKNAPLIQIGSLSKEIADIQLGPIGIHQKWNAQIVKVVCDLLNQQKITVPWKIFQHTLATLKIPGRMETISEHPLIIIDGAHNRASAVALGQTLSHYWPKHSKTILFGASHDKDVEGMFLELSPFVERWIFTKAPDTSRAIEPLELLHRWQLLQATLTSNRTSSATVPLLFNDYRDAVAYIAESEHFDSFLEKEEAKRATESPLLYCVTGSFYLAAAFAREKRGHHDTQR